jgi:hypothetical protein
MRSVTQTCAQPKLIRKNVYSRSHSGSPSRRLRLALDLALDRSFEARKRIPKPLAPPSSRRCRLSNRKRHRRDGDDLEQKQPILFNNGPTK